MNAFEKVAYLKGLAEGLDLDKSSKEAKLFAAIIDALEELASEMEAMEDDLCELEEGIDIVSDDLADVEDTLYEEEDDEDEDCYATTCPTCEEEIFFDDSVLDEGEVICPNCGEKLEFDLSDLANSVDGDD